MQVGLLVFIPCFAGLIMALIALRGCYKIPAMRSSFGYLTRYEMYLRITACSNSGSFYLFGVLFDIKLLLNNSEIFGLISTTLVPIVISVHFVMSINRFLAIVTPFYYNTIFSLKYRRIYVSLCFFVPIVYTPVFTWYYNCGYKFYHYGWVFSFIISETCGNKFEVLLRTVQSVLFLNTTCFLDFSTLILLVCFRKRVLKTKSPEIRKRELNFAQQVLIQGFISLLFLLVYSLGYQWLPGSIGENWKIFWTSSFFANSLHIFTIGTIFVFNAEFSKWLRCGNLLPARSVSVVNPVV
ncbi:unnamed protein product [Caenorhabditis angaria]|uniref:7TM GPCR serpentine receptor class x (Srx) domain-containing protein n=1 Tax=Caenorhabditis angaria TaxID=860376 RepID=A0A9P1ITB5_9PELO|nr:unnamed protein product [Caenorhabditis angaria]